MDRAEDGTPIVDLNAAVGGGAPKTPPEESPAANERRRVRRFDVELPVTVRILVEEQTFSPFSFEGVCSNISGSGALAKVRDMTMETYKLLIHRSRYVRLTCNPEGREKPLLLFGKVVWYDYKEAPAPSICQLGINFEQMEDDVVRDLESYLETLSARKGA